MTALLAALFLLADNKGFSPIVQTEISPDPTTITTKGARRAVMTPAAMRRLHKGDTAQLKLLRLQHPEALELAKFLREYKSGSISDHTRKYYKDENLVKQTKGDPVAILITRYFEFYNRHENASNYLSFLNGGKLNTATALELISLKGSLIPRTFDSAGNAVPVPKTWTELEHLTYKSAPNSVRQAITGNRLTDPQQFWHQITTLITCANHGDDLALPYSVFYASLGTATKAVA